MSFTRIASVIGLLIAVCIANPSSAASDLRCRSISFDGRIRAGEKFTKPIGGGLALVLTPQEFGSEPSVILSGWNIGLYLYRAKTSQDAAQDLIWPVNPPFHFNPIQDIATSYGITAIEKLRHSIHYDFVLNWADYQKISTLASDAIWPTSAKAPDRAGENYLSALRNIRLGQMVFSPIRYATSKKGLSIDWLEFHVQISVPADFAFANALAPRPAACPVRKS